MGKEEGNDPSSKDGEAPWPQDLLSEVSLHLKSRPRLLNPNSVDEEKDKHPIWQQALRDPVDPMDSATPKKKNDDLCKTSVLGSDSDSHCHIANPSSDQIESAGGNAEPVRVRVSENQVKLLCSFGGRIMPRPIDGKLRYVGGDTRIISINRGTSFCDFMSKIIGFFSFSGSDSAWPLVRIKYQLPNEDLDALVSVTSDDDMQNMIEESEKASGSGNHRLRLFFFLSSPGPDMEYVVSEQAIKSGAESVLGIYGDSSSQEQFYVNAINGNVLMNTGEDVVASAARMAGSHRQQQQQATIYSKKTACSYKDVGDNLMTSHSKSPSTPISAPSSPSLAPRHKSGFAGIDANSLQGLKERLSQVDLHSQQQFEGPEFRDNQFVESVESASYSNASYHHEPQWYKTCHESSNVLHHDLPPPQYSRLSNQNCTKLGMDYVRPKDWHRCDQPFTCLESDSPRNMVHHDLSIPRNVMSDNTMECWRSISNARQLARPLKHSVSQLQLSEQLDQQVWHKQSDTSDADNVEHYISDLHYKQAQSFDLLHHQPAHHGYPNVSGHDVGYRNAEEQYGKPLFVQVPPRKHVQAMHGSSPPSASHIGPSLSGSPRVNRIHDYNPSKCSCGLQNSLLVHWGVTASIEDQSCNVWQPHVNNGDTQSMRKNIGARPFSRFCDNMNHPIDPQSPRQPILRTDINSRDQQIGNSWYHVHRKTSRDYQMSESYQAKNCALQYADIAPQHLNLMPASQYKCYGTRKQCFCDACSSDRNQLVVMGDASSSAGNRKDQMLVPSMQNKGFELSGKENFAAKVLTRRCEAFEDSSLGGKSCRATVSSPKVQLAGVEATKVIEVPHNGVIYERRAQIHQNGISYMPVKEHEFYLDGNSTPVHTVCQTHLLSPDVIPLDSLVVTEESSYIVQMQDSVAVSTLRSTVDDQSCLNAPTSPVYDRTPLQSVHTTPFSFSPSNEGSPRAELDDVNEELFGARVSDTKLLADGMISLIPDSSSNEGIFLEEDRELEDSSSNGGVFLDEDKEPEGSFSNEKLLLEEEREVLEDSSSLNGAILPDEDVKDNDSLIYIEAGPSQPDCTKNGIEMPANSNIEKSSFDPKVTEACKDSLVIESSTANGWVTVEMERKSKNMLQQHNSAENLGFNEMHSIGEKDKEEIGERQGGLRVEEEARARGHGLQIIRNSDLEDLKELGSGTFGTVFHGKWRGSDVAIKRIKASCFTDDTLQRERLISDFWKEACTLGQLHHPNVVAFYGVVPDGPDGTLATVTEYMVNGSLKQVLHKKDRTIDRRKRLFIAMDAAFGMEYLHSKNIVHFDLKCENLLVNMRDAHRPICKVGDFGLSKVKHQTLVSGGVRGTLPWMAPELLTGNTSMVTEKVDVFSFGVVMWELLTGEEPYASLHCGAIIGGIVNNTLRPSIPNWCDPGWRDLMERCWSGDPSQRPSFSDVARELRAIAASMNMK